MLFCLQCNKELIGNQKKFCCDNHKNNWRARNIYGYKWQKEYRSKSPRNYLSQLRSYHNRKTTLSLDFLEKLYYTQQGKCALSGVDLTFTQGGGRCPTNISIDRIDSDKGYETDNVQFVCHRINIMKSEGSKEELLEWCKILLAENAHKEDPRS